MQALEASDLPSVLQLLNGALSQAPLVQKHAEGVLATLETRPGFCSCLAVRSARSRCMASAQHACMACCCPGDHCVTELRSQCKMASSYTAEKLHAAVAVPTLRRVSSQQHPQPQHEPHTSSTAPCGVLHLRFSTAGQSQMRKRPTCESRCRHSFPRMTTRYCRPTHRASLRCNRCPSCRYLFKWHSCMPR